MMWGSCAATGVGNLVFIEGNINAEMYINILKENLHASAKQLAIRHTFQMYQDNDPKHKVWETRMWFKF